MAGRGPGVTRDFSSRAHGRARWGTGERALVTAAGLLLALVGWWVAAVWSDHRHASARVQAAREELAGARSRAQANPSRRSPDDALVSRAVLTTEAPPGSVLKVLAALLPPDVRLDGLTLKYGERLELDLRVAARNAKAYDLFLSRLEASPLFERVEPGEENREGEVRTTVRAAFKGGMS